MSFTPHPMSPNTLPLPAARSPSPAALHGWRLTLARVAWLAIAGVSVALLILLIPINLRGIYSDWQFQGMYPVVARFLTRSTFAAYVLTVNYLVAFVCLVTASLIAWRKAEDRVAWLTATVLVMTPVMFSLGGYTDTWAYYPRPWRDLFHWARETMAWVGGTVGITSFFFLFPNGRFAPRWMRWVYGLAIALQLLFAAWLFLVGDEGGAYARWLFTFIGALVVAMVGQLYRYRRVSSPLERQQIKWVVVGLTIWVATFVAFIVLTALTENTPYRGLTLLIANHTEWFALAGLPLTLAFSIFRYRLWDIDPLLNRALVYGGLTICIVGIYGLIVGGLGVLFRQTGNELFAILATGAVAVTFQPLRERLQRLVNRLMYGDRDDPATVLARLGQRLESALAPNSVLPTIVETVARALKAPYAAIEVDSPTGMLRDLKAVHDGQSSVISAEWKADSSLSLTDHLITIPLMYQSETIGRLLIAPRAPGEVFTPADLRLLNDLARQAAPAVHAQRLTADLHRSRERLIIAREEERRRLRRDLHDGLGPTLASQTFKLDAALDWLDRDPAAARKLLGEVKAQTQATVSDIRRLVYELRPPALDELGLVGALRAHIQSLPPDNGLRVTVDAPLDLPPLSAAVEVAAYRIALEALTNVVRHAQASACQVHLAIVEEGLQLDIADDGLGLPHETRAGMGLTSMRERADELGGTCVIENRPGGGTRAYAELPITPSAHG